MLHFLSGQHLTYSENIQPSMYSGVWEVDDVKETAISLLMLQVSKKN